MVSIYTKRWTAKYKLYSKYDSIDQPINYQNKYADSESK